MVGNYVFVGLVILVLVVYHLDKRNVVVVILELDNWWGLNMDSDKC